MDFHLSEHLFGKSVPEHRQGMNAVTSYLSTPQPTLYGHVTPIEQGNLNEYKLDHVLSYQLGRPLNFELSNLSTTIISVLNAAYQTIVISPEDTLSITDRYINQYVKRPLPIHAALSTHQRDFIDALMRYAVNHSNVSAYHLAAQSHFQRLAKNAYLDETMQKHYYQYTGVLALINKIESPLRREILAKIHDQDHVLRSAAESLSDSLTYIASSALLHHYLEEVTLGAPISRLDSTNIVRKIKAILDT